MSGLPAQPSLRRMKAFGIRPNRDLGQNFLIDSNLLDVIGREAALAADDVVLEVGGGLGVLSEYLASRVAHVHVVEVDRKLEPALRDALDPHPNTTLHFADAVRLDLAALDPAPTKVVANLPYGVAATVILRVVEELPSVETQVAMVQREVGERLAAQPGSSAYGAPSVLAQLASRGARASAPCRATCSTRCRTSTPSSSACAAPARRPTRSCARSSAPASRTGARRSPARWRWPAWTATGPARRWRRSACAARRAGRRCSGRSNGARCTSANEAATLDEAVRPRTRQGQPLPLRRQPREDGLHPLVSVVQALSLADELTLEPAAGDADEVVCPGVEGPNLAARALQLFREATGWDGPPQRLTIEKRIPVAAGMGGGSSDAAAALRLAAHAVRPADPARARAASSAPTSPASSAPAAC